MSAGLQFSVRVDLITVKVLDLRPRDRHEGLGKRMHEGVFWPFV